MTGQTGLAASFGWAEEPTFGTFQTPDHWVDFVSESLAFDIDRIEGKGIRAGQTFLRSDHWAPGKKMLKGDVKLELMNRGYGQLLELCVGGSATSVTASGGRHAYTWTPAALKSATLQVGIPDTADNTVTPYNWLGCVVDSWKLETKVDGTVDFTPTFVGRDFDPGVTHNTLTAPSYATGLELLTFVGASVTVSGSAIPVHSLSWDMKNGLDSSRFFLGTPLMSQPLQGALRDYGGSFEAERTADTSLLNWYLNAQELQLVATYAGVANPSHNLVITSNVRADGDVAQVAGPDIVNQPITFKVTEPTGGGFSMTYTTPDASL